MIIIIDLCPVTRVNMFVARTCVVEACDMRGEVTVYCCNPAPVTPDCDCTSCKGVLIFALGSFLARRLDTWFLENHGKVNL